MATSEAVALRLVLVGWGAIARAAARLLRDRGTPVEIVAVAMRDPTRSRPDLPPEARRLTSPHDLGQIEVALANRPLDDNPKSSAITALNIVRCIENRLSPVVI